MKKTDRHYEEFGRLVCADALPPGSFTEVCRAIGAPPRKLDRIIRRELGSSGEEFIHLYRRLESF